MMNNRQYNPMEREREERRRHSRNKYFFINTMVVVIILAIIAAVVIIVVSALNKNNAVSPAPGESVVSTNAQTATQAPDKPTEAPATVKSSQANTQAAMSPTEASVPSAAPAEQSTQTVATGAASADPASANVLHYYATGKTTEGYQWDYSGGGGVVSINCTYDFSSQKYDFTIKGVAEGTASFTLMYWTDDNQTVSVPMTVKVAPDLSVTQIG